MKRKHKSNAIKYTIKRNKKKIKSNKIEKKQLSVVTKKEHIKAISDAFSIARIALKIQSYRKTFLGRIYCEIKRVKDNCYID